MKHRDDKYQKRFSFVSLAVLLTIGGSLSLLGCGRDHETSVEDSGELNSEIVHGHSVSSRDRVGKSVVALVAQNQSGQALCTGSIVSEDTILTAAHCVDHDMQELAIVFGPRVHGVKSENLRKATSFVQNPRWKKANEAPSENSNSKSRGRGDLALVHFEGGLPSGYQAVELAARGQALEENESVVMVGYGVIDGVTGTGSGVLRETKTTFMGKQSSTEFVTDGKQSSVCFGDSGGPAFVEDGGHYLQVGVASSVLNQACNQASVHTSVAGYASWIKSASARLRKGKAKPKKKDQQDELKKNDDESKAGQTRSHRRSRATAFVTNGEGGECGADTDCTCSEDLDCEEAN